MILYDYFRSSAAYRVRIALNLKGLDYEHCGVNLVADEQCGDDYTKLNPQRLVPTLALSDGTRITQSLAIVEYLEEAHPEPALLPADSVERARVRAIAQVIACDIHPLNNLRVLNYLSGPLSVGQDARNDWYKHWIALGFAALESQLASGPSTSFCHGDTPTLADVCLVPQVFNANRFKCDLGPYPNLVRVTEHAKTLPAFEQAHPMRQPDAP